MLFPRFFAFSNFIEDKRSLKSDKRSLRCLLCECSLKSQNVSSLYLNHRQKCREIM